MNMSVSDRILVSVRLAVAVAVSYVLTYLAMRWHVVLSPHTDALVQGAVQSVVAVLYHQAVSWLQRQWPGWMLKYPALRWFSWLVTLALLSNRQPVAISRPRAAVAGMSGRG